MTNKENDQLRFFYNATEAGVYNVHYVEAELPQKEAVSDLVDAINDLSGEILELSSSLHFTWGKLRY